MTPQMTPQILMVTSGLISNAVIGANLSIPLFDPEMANSRFIDGVLLNRHSFYKSPKSTYPSIRFQYQRYTFPTTALHPGAYSSCIPMLLNLLALRILYIYTPESIGAQEVPVDLSDALSFFGYWPSAQSWQSIYTHGFQSSSMVFFRDDHKPLDPKQMEVLWRFCDHLFLVITTPIVLQDTPSGELLGFWALLFLMSKREPGGDPKPEFKILVSLVKGVWRKFCTVNDFNAFFELWKYWKLLNGDESWREIRSMHDV